MYCPIAMCLKGHEQDENRQQCYYHHSMLVRNKDKEQGHLLTFGPSFHFSMTPGLKFSTKTSTLLANCLMMLRPPSCLMSTVMQRLLRP